MHFFNGDFMEFNKKVLSLLASNAKKALRKGEVPISAVVFDCNGCIVSSGFNNRQGKRNVLGHAEVISILKAEKKVKDWRLNDCYMVVSLEPCKMCKAIIEECRIKRVYYFLKSGVNHSSSNDFFCEVEGYEKEKSELKNLLTDFFDNMR